MIPVGMDVYHGNRKAVVREVHKDNQKFQVDDNVIATGRFRKRDAKSNDPFRSGTVTEYDKQSRAKKVIFDDTGVEETADDWWESPDKQHVTVKFDDNAETKVVTKQSLSDQKADDLPPEWVSGKKGKIVSVVSAKAYNVAVKDSKGKSITVELRRKDLQSLMVAVRFHEHTVRVNKKNVDPVILTREASELLFAYQVDLGEEESEKSVGAPP